MNKNISIGIFGDSFAARSWGNSNLAWPELLEKDHGYTNITNFAEPASSLYFSYDKFVKYQHKFEKIIFVVTTPGRFSFTSQIEIPKGTHRHFLPNVHAFSNIWSDDVNYKNAVDAVKKYFTYLYNDTEDLHKTIGLVHNLKLMRPDALLIPTCFIPMPSTLASVNLLKDPRFKSAMNEIARREIEITGNNYHEVISKGRDSRNSHMSQTNNKIFAEKIANYLETDNFLLDVNDFVFDKDLDITTIFKNT